MPDDFHRRSPLSEICEAARTAGRLPGARGAYRNAALSLILECAENVTTRHAAELYWPIEWSPDAFRPAVDDRRGRLILAAGALLAELHRIDSAAIVRAAEETGAEAARHEAARREKSAP